VHTEVHDGIATIVISNPARRNALSRSMMAELGKTLRRIDEDPEVAVTVVRGEGETFVAGADINEFEAQQSSTEARGRPTRQSRSCSARSRTCPSPWSR
jgi:enoyl-CoA hydratase/carnithine racemase